MRQSHKLCSLLIALLLLFSSTGQPGMAQDNPDANDSLRHQSFIPLVINEDVDRAQGESDGDNPAQVAEGLRPVDGSISPLLSEGTDKATISAAAQTPPPLKAVSLIVTFDSATNADKVQAIPDGQIVHRYKHVFNGLSIVTNETNASTLAALEGVTGVYLDQLMQPDTDVSPTFIGANTIWNLLGGQGRAGEGVIVGVLDSGVWPEHLSFSDPDPAGKPYAPPPAPPSGVARACQFGSTVAGDTPFTCNNKLIGAYRFMSTYDAVIGLLSNEFRSARDDNGHGTHTTTTAAGNAGVRASIYGIDRGIISGIAPRAYVIAYKVCGDQGCFQSDSVAAIDQAIDDGVNTINFSISGGNNPFADAVELAFLNAYDHGIFVAASAGNAGPGLDTVSHRGPWVTTVAASTSNRHFLSTVTLTADNGDTLALRGATVTDGISAPTPVVFAPDLECDPMPAGSLTGKIAICDRVGARLTRGFNAAQAGAVGMLLLNTTQLGVLTDNHFLPSVHIDQADGVTLRTFMNNHTGVTATFTRGAATAVPGDMMASFSSRGGPAQTLGVNKPDVTAPGVQILAGNTPMGATPLSGFPGQLFQSIQGTSMSSPHVAGAGALLKALHPTWTPGQIKSALMTTAKTENVVKEDGATPADAYDYGAGRIDLTLAGDPGITFDEQAANFVALQNALWNANYPSLYHPALPGTITVQRTAQDVTGRKANWQLTTKTDKNDWRIIVPDKLEVPANGQATFNITIDAGAVPLGQVRFGVINLASGRTRLHIPVTFVRGQASVTVAKRCDPVNFARNTSTTCTITMQNTAFVDANVSMTDRLPENMTLVPGSLTGGLLAGPSTIAFAGQLQGALPPQVSVSLVDVATTPGGGYLPLSTFGISPIAGAGDETIHNFNVPSFVYGGELYTRIGIVSNGYVVMGGGTAGDVQFVNTNLPDANRPNNLLAPFWTDLNPAFGGAMRVGVLTDGVNSWIVIDFAGVVNYSDRQPNDFEIWIGINGVEDVSFVYGRTSNGEGGAYTVGAENRFGNVGGAIFYNGAGTPPAAFGATQGVDVTSAPGAAGPVQTVSFQMKAEKKGRWQNCANLTADTFQGVAISCVSGTVNK